MTTQSKDLQFAFPSSFNHCHELSEIAANLSKLSFRAVRSRVSGEACEESALDSLKRRSDPYQGIASAMPERQQIKAPSGA
jgi:hypothetical protein